MSETPSAKSAWPVLLLRCLAVVAAYVAAGRISREFMVFGANVALVWLPAGVAVAAVLRWGAPMAAAVVVGAFVLAQMHGQGLVTATALALAHAIGALAAMLLLRRVSFRPDFERRSDVRHFLILGVGAAMALAAGASVVALALAGAVRWAELPQAFATGWFGDAIGVLAVGVPLLALSRDGLAGVLRNRRGIAISLALSAIILLGLTEFVGHEPAVGLGLLVFVPFVLVAWLVGVGGILPGSFAALGFALVAIVFTHPELAVYRRASQDVQVASLLGYIVALCLLSLWMSAVLAELRASEQRWQFALDGAGAGVWDLNLATGRAFYSSRWKALLGYRDDEIGDTNEEWRSRVHPDDLAHSAAAMDAHVGGATPEYRAEFRMRDRAGGWRWVQATGRIIARDPRGRPLRVIGTQSDVTERRAAEAALTKSRSRLRSILDASPVAILLLDRSLSAVYANATALDLFRVASGNPADISPGTLTHPDDLPGTLQALEQVGQGAGPVTVEKRYRRHDGSEFWADVTLQPFSWDDGDPEPLVMASVRDITLRKLAAEHEVERRAIYRAMFESTQIPKLLSEAATGAIIDANPAAADFFGRSRETLATLRFGDIATPVAATGGAGAAVDPLRPVGEYELRGADGSLRNVELRSSPVVHGGRAAIFSIVLDITERRSGERRGQRHGAILEMLARGAALPTVLEAIVHTIEDDCPGWVASILRVDAAGHCLRNGVAPTIPSFFRDACEGLPIAVGSGSCGTAVARNARVVIDDIATHPYWDDYRDLAARAGFVSCWSEPVVDAAGLPVGSICAYSTVRGTPTTAHFDNVATAARLASIAIERDRRDADLRERDELLRMISEQVPGMLFEQRTRPDGCSYLSFASAGIRRMFELQPDDVQDNATPMFRRMHPDDYRRAVESATQAAARLEPWHGEYRVVLPQQGVRWRSAHGVPTNSPDGGIVWHGYVDDITERVEAEQRARELNANLERHVADRTADLERALRELEAFSYTVSHDLRAPLRAMSGFSQILLDDESARLSEEGRRILARVVANANHMAELIDDILEYARVGRSPVKLASVDLHALAAEFIERHASDGGHARFVLDPLPAVEADPTMMRQVLHNLLGNALKFSARRAPPEVRITGRVTDGRVVCCIADNGVGFDMAYADKLFGMFQRLHSEREYQGTGVGLAIVKRLVERQGGRVWAESAPDAGARFYFELKAAVSAPQAAVEAAA